MLYTECISSVTGVDGGGGGEDLYTLEAEISELQKENARVESQMLRLKTDISAMEAHLRHGNDKVMHFLKHFIPDNNLK